MKKNYGQLWPVGGVCDLGCQYYIYGSLKNEDIGINEHCRFDGTGPDGDCGKNTLITKDEADAI